MCFVKLFPQKPRLKNACVYKIYSPAAGRSCKFYVVNFMSFVRGLYNIIYNTVYIFWCKYRENDEIDNKQWRIYGIIIFTSAEMSPAIIIITRWNMRSFPTRRRCPHNDIIKYRTDEQLYFVIYITTLLYNNIIYIHFLRLLLHNINIYRQ